MNMRLSMLLVPALGLSLGVGEPANDNFTAPLKGDQEVPPVETNATGVATFKLSKDGLELSYKVNVGGNIENVTQAHIHIGERGENGPVTVFLFGPSDPPVSPNGPLADGTITADDLIGPLEGQTLSALIEEMAAGGTYVNVHTTANPSGEIRGQIERGSGMKE